jgi:hypothetical protein
VRLIKLILSLLPLVYIGWLLIHFTSFDGWSDGMLAGGLGPTVLGLGAVGLLLSAPVIFRLMKFAITPRGPITGEGAELAEVPAFDADAALARYMARKADGQGAEMPPSTPNPDAPRPVFGRKISSE